MECLAVPFFVFSDYMFNQHCHNNTLHMISAKQLTLVLMYLSVESNLDSSNIEDNEHIKAINHILGQDYVKELLQQISELDILVVPSVLQLPVLSKVTVNKKKRKTEHTLANLLAEFCQKDDLVEEAFLKYQSENNTSLAVSPIPDTSPSRTLNRHAKRTLLQALSQFIDATIQTADDYYDLLRMLEEKTNVMIFPFLDVERHMEVSHLNLTLFRSFLSFCFLFRHHVTYLCMLCTIFCAFSLTCLLSISTT
jgi:hypothetical protein